MRSLRTSEAAQLLNVSANTLRSWEQRFGFPRPLRSDGGQRRYAHGELQALREALNDGLSVESAISQVREALGADSGSLLAALRALSAGRATGAMEASLALRSVERSIEEVMLEALDRLARSDGTDSAIWAWSCQWATDWLRRARMVAPEPHRDAHVLVGDATGEACAPDEIRLRAFEVFCARKGMPVTTLPVFAAEGLAEVVEQLSPAILVVAGTEAKEIDVRRWAYAARRAAPLAQVVLLARSGSEPELGPGPAEAVQGLLALL